MSRPAEAGGVPGRLRLTSLGIVAGVLGGLLGVGGGFVLVPLQVLYAGMGQRRAQATSLAAIIPGSIVAALIYTYGARTPEIDFRLALLLVIGSVVGAYFGALALRRLPEQGLRQVFAVLLVLLAVKELIRP